MAGRTRVMNETDAAAWAGFASRIAPLAGRRAAVAPPPEVGVAVQPRPTGPLTPSPARATAVDVGQQPAGIDKATWERFRRGQIGGVRKLDLHGMTARDAFAKLRGFLRVAHADRVRCVEVVTGRGNGEGSGVLRRELPLWLNLPDIRPMVLAAVHPHTSNAMHSNIANPGSVRLLLRKPRGTTPT
jgi:DNA-nicking Smr family endonuclease